MPLFRIKGNHRCEEDREAVLPTIYTKKSHDFDETDTFAAGQRLLRDWAYEIPTLNLN